WDVCDRSILMFDLSERYRRRHLRNRGRLQELAEIDFDAETLPNPGNYLHRHQGVPAQLEETVIHSDLVYAEHLRPDSGQLVLNLIARRNKLDFHCEPVKVWRRQVAPSDLAL